MARELLAIDEDLPFRFKDPYHTRVDYFELYTFEQSWADTTCGFGGMGGQAITTAKTYVFVPDSYDSRCYRMLISKELFVGAYNKWIKGE